MTDGPWTRTYSPPAGLCETCFNVKVIESRKGSRFYLCRLAAVDPAFPKYPRTPVLRCRGYVEGEGEIERTE